MTKFRTGQRVVDIETGAEGRVIFKATDAETTQEIVAVWFDGDCFAAAWPRRELRHASH